MDLGAPYKELAQFDVAELQARLLKLTDAEWDARPIRRASLAGDAHNVADSIVMRHEWMPGDSKRGFGSLQESLLDWARRNKRDARMMLPFMEEKNSETWVYTFYDWFVWQKFVVPIIVKSILGITDKPRGVLSRALFVRLRPGHIIEKHVDGQEVASRTHRIHVCISDTPGCIYTVGGESFSMKPGIAYDFNNVWEHGVENTGDRDRINLMLEYIPEPEWIMPTPVVFSTPGSFR